MEWYHILIIIVSSIITLLYIIMMYCVIRLGDDDYES